MARFAVHYVEENGTPGTEVVNAPSATQAADEVESRMAATTSVTGVKRFNASGWEVVRGSVPDGMKGAQASSNAPEVYCPHCRLQMESATHNKTNWKVIGIRILCTLLSLSLLLWSLLAFFAAVLAMIIARPFVIGQENGWICRNCDYFVKSP